MSITLPRQLGRELLRLATRPQPALPSFELCAARQVNPSLSRPFSFRSAFREAAAKSTPRTSTNPRGIGPLPVLAAGGSALAILLSVIQPFASTQTTVPTELQTKPDLTQTPTRTATIPHDDPNADGLPRYRLSEVKEHGPKSERPWVIYEDKIYDITDWVPGHPGGEVILRAAGGSIEAYWNIFSIHKTPYIREILDQYLVGKVHPDDLRDGRPSMEAIADPFEADPVRDERLQLHTAKPCNAEPPAEEVADTFLTPNEVFYVRNHMWVPVIEDATGESHGITIELPDGDVRTYTIADLKVKFKQHTVTAVLQCSGNRRKHMTEHATKTNGLQWDVGAISCAKWEGVRLRDVLADAGFSVDQPPDEAQHVQFSGLEAYGASIPIHSALDPRGDVLLAFKMNDQPLPRDHGFPVRVIVPGTVAARCVKWVNKIVISDEESNTTWQRRDYKCFGPNETKNMDWDKYKSIQEMPITSAITRTRLKSVSDNQVHSGGGGNDSTNNNVLEIEGYAYSGGGREVQRVDVSLDGGKTWDQARLLDDSDQEQGSKKWSWKRWTYEAPLPKDEQSGKSFTRTTLVVKATDEAYNTQPQCYRSIYNLRGNLATAWHRVEFDASERLQKEKTMA